MSADSAHSLRPPERRQPIRTCDRCGTLYRFWVPRRDLLANWLRRKTGRPEKAYAVRESTILLCNECLVKWTDDFKVFAEGFRRCSLATAICSRQLVTAIRKYSDAVGELDHVADTPVARRCRGCPPPEVRNDAERGEFWVLCRTCGRMGSVRGSARAAVIDWNRSPLMRWVDRRTYAG